MSRERTASHRRIVRDFDFRAIHSIRPLPERCEHLTIPHNENGVERGRGRSESRASPLPGASGRLEAAAPLQRNRPRLG
jgi:hypothetical protein